MKDNFDGNLCQCRPAIQILCLPLKCMSQDEVLFEDRAWLYEGQQSIL